jgi:SAM-dependent methyltransferase
LPVGCAAAVITIDVLQLLDEPAALLREAVRLLRPYGRLVATTWEVFADAPARFPRNLAALVEHAGLRLES